MQPHPWCALIASAASGDAAALGLLYDQSSALVYSVAMRILQNGQDAEEVALDVFTQVWRGSAAYDAHRGSPSSWLVMLTRSRAIDRLRTRRARFSEEAVTEIDGLPPGPRADDSEAVDRHTVSAALSKLSPEHRDLLELAFYSGFSHAELAERLNLPLGTVKTRIRLAIVKMRDLLRGTGTYK